MSLNDVTFVKGQGGLGRPLPGEDYISGLLFYRADGNLPSGFSTSNRILEFFSIQDAQAAGILLNYSDETQAVATYAVSAAGATGDTVLVQVVEISGTVTIGSYTRPSTDTSTTLVGAGIAAAINAGTLQHGYSAVAGSGTVSITARKGLGVFLNSGIPLLVTIVGTIAGTITQFTGGVASLLAPMWYHINEYFRVQPKGNLYVGIYAIPSPYTFVEIQTMQNFANGKIRQIGVFVESVTLSTTHINTIQSVCATLDGVHMPLSAIYAANLVSVALTALTDLNLLSDNKVSVVIGQDGAALGYTLFKAYGKSITTLGATLGLVSLAKVSDDIAWVGQFNIGLGTELNVAAFAEGTPFRSASTGLVSQLNGYRYIFIIKQIGIDGTWANDSHCAILSSSDYAYIENNRTIDKAIRNLRIGLLPLIASPLVLNSDGTLSDTSVAAFEGAGDVSLNQMVRDQELSGKLITVDPTQNVQSTSTIKVAVELLGIGVARNINVKIGFVLSL